MPPRIEQIALLTKLGKAWMGGDVSNQAIRENATLEPDIGHRTFAEALKHWEALMAIRSTPAVYAQAMAENVQPLEAGFR